MICSSLNRVRFIVRLLVQDGLYLKLEEEPGLRSIYGNHRRGTGILNNELYLGRLVWNRQRFIKDPNTGRRQARPNPPSDWIIEEVPDLRIVEQELWDAVKGRQHETRNSAISEGILKLARTKRAPRLFSGMLKCGCCGSGFIQVGSDYYGCSATRNKGTCDNRLTIKREDLEGRVLAGLKDQLLHPDLIAEFVRSYQEEFNRLQADARDDRARSERELGKVINDIDKIIDAITEGMFHPSMKSRMDELESRKSRLEANLARMETKLPVLLHPGLSDHYREQVADLTSALNQPSTKAEATSIIRSLLSEIRLIPENGCLAIELVGELAGLLALGSPPERRKPPKGGLFDCGGCGGRI